MSPAKRPSHPRFPLFLAHSNRVYPRPNARAWVDRLSGLFSLDAPAEESPWLPLCVVEGFLVVGHKDASAKQCELPPELTIVVRLRSKDYDRLRSDCSALWQAFVNPKESLPTAWQRHLMGHQANAAAPSPGQSSGDFRRKRIIAALQFIIQHGLTGRHVTPPALADSFLKEHPGMRWVIDMLSAHEPIYPIEELRSEHIPAQMIPESLVARYKAICYCRDEEGYHVVLPAKTSLSVFRTSLGAQLDNPGIKISVAYADPDATNKFVDHASVGTIDAADADDLRKAEAGDDSELDCTLSEQLKTQQYPSMTDAREVLRKAIGEAIAGTCTDVHIEPLDSAVAVIRHRRIGKLRPRGSVTNEMLGRVVAVIKTRCRGMHSTERRLPQDGKFRVRYADREVEVRVSTIPVEKGGPFESVELRILGQARIKSLEEIGFTPYQLKQVQWVLGRDYGIFLITGPTNSGKSTTLNCMERSMAREEISIMTAEDPVEMSLPFVKRVQVHKEIGLTHDKVLEHMLRHDPDVMAVGEIRDRATAKMAVDAAHTGKLVFATLHANTACTAPLRLQDLGVTQDVVSESLVGVCGQRLINCLCTCREEIAIPAEQRDFMLKFQQKLRCTLQSGAKKRTTEAVSASPEAEDLDGAISAWLTAAKTYRPGDCPACNGTGFVKQRAVAEIYLMANEPCVVALLHSSAPAHETERYFSEIGHLNIAGQCVRAIVRHETTYAEVARYLPLL